MKFQIKHEIKGRLRIHMKQSRMTFEQADILHYAIQKMDGVSSVKVYERTGDAVICFHCSREELVDALSAFDYDRVNVPMEVLQNSGRQLNAEFQENWRVGSLEDSLTRFFCRCRFETLSLFAER